MTTEDTVWSGRKCYTCICSDLRCDRALTVCFYITVADLCLSYGLAGCALGTDVTGPCLCCFG